MLGLAWVATIMVWQDPLTALYARKQQRQLAAAYEERVREFQPQLAVSAARDVPVSQMARQFRRTLADGAVVGRLRIPAIGLNTLVVNGTDSASLKRGPGLDQRTHMPGEGQLVYIAGHRTTYLAPFSHIDRLERGDMIELSTPYATVRYRVTSHVIVPATDLARLKSRGREELALQACHPRFFATQRYIVYAEPVTVLRAHAS